jgi:D-alanyl-D-alanine carboxypeptidase
MRMGRIMNIKSINELEKFIIQKKTPCISLIAVKENKILYENNFGFIDINKYNKPSQDTLYKIWSITKIFTAIAIMNIHNQKIIDIEEPIIKYLPYLKFYYKSKEQNNIKIKYFLNHSSGLNDNILDAIGWIYFEKGDRPNQTELLRKIISNYSILKYLPGKKGYYSSVNYMILGALIEKVSNKSYENYIIDNILIPLKMNNTHFELSKQIKNTATGTHPLFSFESILISLLIKGVRLKINIKKNKLWFDTYYPLSSPPSGLISTTSDIALFLKEIINEHTLISKDLISFMTEKELVNRSGKDKNIKYGLGWKVFRSNSDYYIFHDGIGPGFSSSLRIYPEKKLGFCIMTNNMYFKCNYIIDVLFKLLERFNIHLVLLVLFFLC